MSDYLQRIADEWSERASELAAWTMDNLVNRTDVWGRYLAPRYRGTGSDGKAKNKAITAPFKQERGKIFLQSSSLEKHFKARHGGGILGLHSASKEGTSRWLAFDIDLHDDDDLSVTREGNFVAATSWYQRLVDLGFDPLLTDSNGKGGFHLLLIFERPMDTRSVQRFCNQFVSDFQRLGLDRAPDLFPGSLGTNNHGSWLRLPGRHHTREHFTRVWNDEPWADKKWLEGHEAIDRILDITPASDELLQQHGLTIKPQTICLDFDGVIHSYQHGWQGEDVINDPPVHKVDMAIKELRKDYRVVVFSARCRTDKGVAAIEAWLNKHNIEVDEVCRNKPPALVYVDDRAVRFSGDWQQTIADIHSFKK
ncbi:MAG: hypothetical protein AAFN77_03210 [Planctomycetota bacterium]